MKEIYGWVPWFGELAGKIAEGGETYLAEAAKRVAWRDDDDEQPLPLLKHGDENIDPFSFFYSLAQRGQDAGSRMRIFPSINKEFNMERQPPVESDDPIVFSGCKSAFSSRKAERGTRTTASWFGNQTRHTVAPTRSVPLFLNDLAGAVMNGAVLPTRFHPLITLYLDLLPAESESQVQCEF